MMKLIEINGQDGGGQILRSALSLSMVTGQGFRMTNIRGQRSKPGLMRQHLTCVHAAAEVCGALVNQGSGAELHDVVLEFIPGRVKAGIYTFRIGTAGSTTLLFQTLLPALMLEGKVSTIELYGGTHNPMAPSADFIERAYLPQLKKMGVEVEFECLKYGFAPAGGGCLRAVIRPVAELLGFSLMERGEALSRRAESVLAHVNEKVGERELLTVQKVLGWKDKEMYLKQCDLVEGSGNILSVEEEYENIVVHVCSHGMQAKSAERVGREAAKSYLTFVKSKAAVDVRLADQLLLPLALAGEGELSTVTMTNHIKTNIQVIESFCSVKFRTMSPESGVVHVNVSQNE